MPSRRQRPIFQVPIPLYGLNDKDDPYTIHDFEAADIENIEIGEGVAFSRLGTQKIGGTVATGAIMNMYDYRKSDGTSYLVRARQDVVEYWDTDTSDWVEISLPVTLTSELKVSFVTLNDLLIISNGTDSDIKWDGTTATELASNPKADVQIIHQNRLIKFKFSNSRMYYSNINDPETFDAADYHTFDPNNAAMGTAISALNGQIIAFKENKKYVLTQLVGGSIIPLSGSISTVSHYSVVSTGSTLVFLGNDGWYELSGSVTQLISDHIDMTGLDHSRLVNAHAVYHNNRYRCFVTESGNAYNNLEYVFYMDSRTPFPTNPYPVVKNRGRYGNCYATTVRSGQETLYYGDSRPNSGSPATQYGYVYEVDSGYDDDGESIAAFYETKLFDNNRPFFSKKYKRIFTRAFGTGSMTVYMAYRFTTKGSWNEVSIALVGTTLSWVLDDDSEVTLWDEGYGFPLEDITDSFEGVENTGRPKTIQIRNRCDSDANQARWIYQAYRYRLRDKFK